MRKMMGLAAAAAVLVLATSSSKALAQGSSCLGPDCIYSLSYYSNAHTAGAPDATLRLVNDGFIADSSPAGDLCASIYVFDNNEEMMECCSCRITPNGLLTLSVNALTSNTVTSVVPKRGVIKILSSIPIPSTVTPSVRICVPTLVNPGSVLVEGIHGWITHIQKAGATFPQTEEELTDASLDFVSGLEFNDLAEDCAVAMELGSGQGVCSCNDAGR